MNLTNIDSEHATGNIHLLRRVRREDAPSGLGPARLSALSVIVFGGPLRISALAEAEQVRVPTMTSVVAALERRGLVEREPDPDDARAVLLRATARGVQLMQDGRARRIAAIAGALRALPQRDRVALARAAPVLERVAGKVRTVPRAPRSTVAEPARIRECAPRSRP